MSKKDVFRHFAKCVFSFNFKITEMVDLCISSQYFAICCPMCLDSIVAFMFITVISFLYTFPLT